MKNIQKKKINLYSPHSVNECYERLSNSVQTPFSKSSDSKPICGEVSQNKLRMFKNIGHKNSFQPNLRASIFPFDGGTKIYGVAGLHPLVKFSYPIILSVFILFPLFFLLLPYFESLPRLAAGFLVTLILLIFIFGLSIVFEKLSGYYSRGESDFLKKSLIDLLDANEI